MAATHYSPTDVLIHTRESLNLVLEEIHVTLEETFGVDVIQGEEYLPAFCYEILDPLYALHRALTDECVRMGAYRRENGRLYRTLAYSHGLPVYTGIEVDPDSGQATLSRLNHPSDHYRGIDNVEAQRTGLTEEEAGGDCDE